MFLFLIVSLEPWNPRILVYVVLKRMPVTGNGPWDSLIRGEDIKSELITHGATQAGGALMR
jgi:hypothetical protein